MVEADEKEGKVVFEVEVEVNRRAVEPKFAWLSLPSK